VTRYLLLLLFFLMLAAPPLGLEVSIAPGLSLKNALLYAVVAAIAVEWTITKNRRLEALPILIPFFALVTYGFLSWLVLVLLVDYPGYSALQTFIVLKSNFADHFIIFLAFFYGVTKTKDALWLLRALIWGVIISNVVTVIDGFNIPDLGIVNEGGNGRMGGLVGDSNDYGAFVAFFLPTTVALFVNSSGMVRLLALIGIFSSIVGLAISTSRGAYVSAVVGSVVAAFYLRAYLPASVIIKYSVTLLLVCIVAGVVVLSTDYRERIEARFTETQASGQLEDLSSGRTTVWMTIFERMLENPTTFITGYGWESYENHNFRFVPHNRYMGLLYNLGLIGLMLFLLTAVNIVKHVRHAIATADSETKPLLMAFVFGFSSMLMTLMFSDIYIPWIFIWAFCGVAVRVAVGAVSDVTPATQIAVQSTIVRRKGPAWQGAITGDGVSSRQSLR
jgi:O-antigen ligase